MRRLVVAAIVIMASVACDARNGSTRDVATWRVEPSPAVAIGDVEGSPEHSFYRIAGVARLGDGRIVVADGASSEIRIFSATRRLPETIGRRGSGPAEFDFLFRMDRTPGDTLVVLARSGRIGIITAEGGVLTNHPFVYPSFVLACRYASSETMWNVTTSALLFSAEDNPGGPGCPPMREGSTRSTTLLAMYHWRDGRVDTLGIFPGLDRTGTNYRVFGRDLAVAVSRDRIYAGDTGADSVFVFTLDGATSFVWKLPRSAVRIPPAARAVAEPPPRVTGDGTIHRFAPYDYPDLYPVFARLVADSRGYLWVMEYPESMEPLIAADFQVGTAKAVPADGAEWVILNREGEWVAMATTPPGLHVLEIGDDYVLGTVRDEYDVESVRMHRLTR